MQFIEYNNESHQIYYILKRNEEADKAAKQAIDMPGITTTRLPFTDYYLIIRRTRTSEW